MMSNLNQNVFRKQNFSKNKQKNDCENDTLPKPEQQHHRICMRRKKQSQLDLPLQRTLLPCCLPCSLYIIFLCDVPYFRANDADFPFPRTQTGLLSRTLPCVDTEHRNEPTAFRGRNRFRSKKVGWMKPGEDVATSRTPSIEEGEDLEKMTLGEDDGDAPGDEKEVKIRLLLARNDAVEYIFLGGLQSYIRSFSFMGIEEGHGDELTWRTLLLSVLALPLHAAISLKFRKHSRHENDRTKCG